MAALPLEQQRELHLTGVAELSAGFLQELGPQLPPGVKALKLCDWASAEADAWPALLPSLPASLEEVRFGAWASAPLTEEQLLALCQAAVRPVKVVVCHSPHNSARALTEEELERIWGLLRDAPRVTLVGLPV